MNYKPDEATLIAYLYGELAGAEKIKVDDYLQQHPEEKLRLEEWSFTKNVMARLEDKEVIAPPIILGDNHHVVPFWNERYFRMTMGIAASLLFILVAAKMMNLSAGYSQGELRIGFGIQDKPAIAAPTLTQQQVNDMIQSSLATNNEALKASWGEERKLVANSLQENLRSSSTKINQLMQTASAANQEQVRDFVSQMQNDNLKLMKDYMQLSTTGQKQYIESLLVDFSSYLQEQRKQDLQLFQARVNKVEENTDQFKEETEQILTSLITNTGTKKRN